MVIAITVSSCQVASQAAPRTIVLAGRIQVESEDGILLRYAGPGEVLVTQHVLRAVTCAGAAKLHQGLVMVGWVGWVGWVG